MIKGNQPLIGLVMSKQGDTTFGCNNAYVAYFAKFGDILPINPLSDVIYDELDLLVLPGGADISPAMYDTTPSLLCHKPNLVLDHFDRVHLPQYIEMEIPIFGICRGFQAINVAFGGKLEQHMAQNFSTKWRGEKVDKIKFTAECPIKMGKRAYYHFSDKDAYETNSIHHQGIPGICYKNAPFAARKGYLGEGLVPIAYNKGFHNVEAIMHEDLPIIGVQWHPEEMNCEFSNKIISSLLEKVEVV